jgi:DNA polymerase (family 10)
MQLEPIIPASDYHVHSIFSDGAHTYDEIAVAAGKMGLRIVAICDHSDEYMAAYSAPRLLGFYHASHRWRNTINSVHVIRGLELDLLSPDGEISNLANYRHRPQFLILSAHKGVYQGPDESITEAYLHAIDRCADELDLIGHPCSTYFGAEWDQGIDIEKIVRYANDANLGIEVNGVNLIQNKTNLEKLRYVCENARILYANSDAHTVHEMAVARQRALEVAKSFGRFENLEV